MTKNESAQPQLPPLDHRTPLQLLRLLSTWLEDDLRIYYAEPAANRLAELEAENESLKAERDQALELIREYRKGGKHQGCNDLIEWQFDGKDHRCSTCIKADALLKEKS